MPYRALATLFPSPKPLRRTLCAGLACVSLAVSAAAHAAWPERPVRLVVPYSPGGATDVIGRIVAQHLGDALGQQVVVENKAGASGNIGAGEVARARADGYTLLMGAMTSHSIMATLEKGRLPYDLLADLTPVHVVGYVPLVFVVHPSVPVQSFSELVQYARSQPDKLTYASSGASSPQRLTAEIFLKHLGVRITHVPYRGSGPAMTDLIGGQVLMMAETVPAALPFITAGRLRPLAVTTPERISMLPDVPTIRESTDWTDADVVSTFGVLAPQGTPAEVVQRLNRAIGTLLQKPEVRQQLLAQGVYALSAQTLAQAQARLKAEVARWESVIRDAGIQTEN